MEVLLRSTWGRLPSRSGRRSELLPMRANRCPFLIPVFVVGGEPVAGYAWAKCHCSYYPHTGAALSELVDELDVYDWSKGTLRSTIDERLPRQLTARRVGVKLAHLRSSA